jgi:putative transcriptional regulator
LLRSQRLGLGLSDLVQKTGLSRNALWYIRSGHLETIRFSSLSRISEVLECEPYELLKPIELRR